MIVNGLSSDESLGVRNVATTIEKEIMPAGPHPGSSQPSRVDGHPLRSATFSRN